MTFSGVERLAIFGGSWIVADLLPELKKTPWEIRVFTSPRHLADMVNAQGETLEQALRREQIAFHCSEDINSDLTALEFAGASTLGIAFGAAWMFEPDFVGRFEGRLLDFMGIPLPEYRGGAHYTWQILNRERRGACHLQIVHGGEETFHKGPVIRSHSYRLPDGARTPQDYFANALREERQFVADFLAEVERGVRFDARPLDELQASLFPFLHTKVHGWIDWSSSADEVDRFICAFDDPYPGASTYWGERRVFLKVSSVQPSGGFHPFARGLVFRADDRGVWICLKDGALLVEKILDEAGNDLTREIVPGSRFITPVAVLEEALASDIVYTASGPLVQRSH